MKLYPDLFSDVISDLENKGASVVVQADPGVVPVDYKIEATWPNGEKWLVEEIRVKGGKDERV